MNIFSKVTLKTLEKNKTRTLVTIIGIILSAAMIMAVATCTVSLQVFLAETVTAQNGNWHGVVFKATSSQIDKLAKDSRVESFSSLQNIGYSLLDKKQNEEKPYLFIGGMNSNFTEKMPVKLTSGRMPVNSSEIIMPKHLKTSGGVVHAIGDSISLDVGDRMSNGISLNQKNTYLNGDKGEFEEISNVINRTYLIVGFYDRPSFEDYSAPGYTALTMADAADADNYDVYIKVNSAKSIYSFLKTQFPNNGNATNNDLLRYIGASNDQNYNAVLYGMAGILILIIMFGSISLIYNAFSISVSERTKQFGLLSSIGATKKQMMRSVYFEAFILSLVGIPIGIISGIAGIGITIKFISNLFMSFADSNTGVTLHLNVSWIAVAVAAIVGLVTVLISAYIPAKRSVRISAIDAIRQTNDINIKAKKVKTLKLTYKIFGLEGMIASKNFKRNRKKYRATVISLFMSVVLFISASSFCVYLSKSAASVIDKVDYDIVYTLTPNEAKKYPKQDLFHELSAVGGVTKTSYAYNQYESIQIPKNIMNPEYLKYISNSLPKENVQAQTDNSEGYATIYFIDDTIYDEYMSTNLLDKSLYGYSSSPKAVALDFVKIYDKGRYYTFNLLNTNKSFDISSTRIKSIDGYIFSDTETDENDNKFNIYKSVEGDMTIKRKVEESTEKSIFQIGTVIKDKPFCVDNNSGLTLVYPYSSIEKVLGQNNEGIVATMYFKTNNHKVVNDMMSEVLDEKNLSTSNLYDIAESEESTRALMTVINVFSYGFIILISLISAANVFNTISTNIGLRRREFAMLKSIGMTRKGFMKMMNFECLLYGIKGLIYGIPVSFGVTYLIYRSVLNGWETSFFIPWHSIVIAVGSVFLVVFATMIYSTSKIKKDNPIDALKDENL